MRAVLPSLALALLLLGVPSVLAHGTLEAREVETLLLVDEADDSFYTTGGYDLYEVYIGEAHLREAGMGAAGDGFYFRTILFGNFAERPPGTNEYRVEFNFAGPDGPMMRYLLTKDGKTFETDFDHLMVTVEDNQVEVNRAFVALQNASLTRQMALRDFRVTSLVDGEVRDRAPGGIYVPRTGGQVEVPMPSEVRADSYTLVGPTKYVAAAAARSPAGNYTLTITSLLKEGEQHVSLATANVTDYTFVLPAEAGGVLKAGGTMTIPFTLEPMDRNGDGALEPFQLDVLSDIGGRVGFVVSLQNGTAALLPEGAVAVAQPWSPETPLQAPLPGLVAVTLAAVGAAFLLRRR
ncbi:MAG TPA: hypothetical protein VNZ52_03325 [Candidatus Thermoplasmatota archaeon]|nr:hypothetical protein [Candidatus Thermoplasmatota archaeon]